MRSSSYLFLVETFKKYKVESRWGKGGQKKKHAHTFIQNLQQRRKLTYCDWKKCIGFPPRLQSYKLCACFKKKILESSMSRIPMPNKMEIKDLRKNTFNCESKPLNYFILDLYLRAKRLTLISS